MNEEKLETVDNLYMRRIQIDDEVTGRTAKKKQQKTKKKNKKKKKTKKKKKKKKKKKNSMTFGRFRKMLRCEMESILTVYKAVVKQNLLCL